MTERTRSPFVPLLILLAALLAWTVFQTVQLRGESESLGALRAGQETQFQQAQRVRQTLDQLATQTQLLADAGNPNARIVVEELRKRGVTINRPGDAAKK
jgi:site-specific recombinase